LGLLDPKRRVLKAPRGRSGGVTTIHHPPGTRSTVIGLVGIRHLDSSAAAIETMSGLAIVLADLSAH
jgi:hypothetical protein